MTESSSAAAYASKSSRPAPAISARLAETRFQSKAARTWSPSQLGDLRVVDAARRRLVAMVDDRVREVVEGPSAGN